VLGHDLSILSPMRLDGGMASWARSHAHRHDSWPGRWQVHSRRTPRTCRRPNVASAWQQRPAIVQLRRLRRAGRDAQTTSSTSDTQRPDRSADPGGVAL